jgi:hypothetical protein
MSDDQQPPPSYCGNCGRDDPVWHAPNDLWNTVVGSEAGTLCPTCFIDLAEERGVVPTAWRVAPEVLPDQQSTPPPLDLEAIEAFWTVRPGGASYDLMRVVAEVRRLRAALDRETDNLLRLESAHGVVLHDREQLRADLAAAGAALTRYTDLEDIPAAEYREKYGTVDWSASMDDFNLAARAALADRP